MEMFNADNIVVKANELINVKGDALTLQQQKIVCAIASKIKKDDTEFTEYTFHVRYLAEVLHINLDGYYTEVRKVMRNLQRKTLSIKKIVDGNVKEVDANWFYRAEYDKANKTVKIKFADDLKPFLLQLKKEFTSYKLGSILKIESSYFFNLYELLKKNAYKKTYEIEIGELYELLNNNYSRFNDFRRNILDKAEKEIALMTDISFTSEPIKEGRRFAKIKFNIKCKDEDETAATKTDKKPQKTKEPKKTKKPEAPKEEMSEETKLKIEKIKEIMAEHKVTDKEALAILKSSEDNLETIQKVYDYSKDKQKDNFIGFIISMVKPGAFIEPKSNVAKTSFNDYEGQRQYDYDKLEQAALKASDKMPKHDEKEVSPSFAPVQEKSDDYYNDLQAKILAGK